MVARSKSTRGERTREKILHCAEAMECTVRPRRVKIRLKGPVRGIESWKSGEESERVTVDAHALSENAGFYERVPLILKQGNGLTIDAKPSSVTLRVRPFKAVYRASILVHCARAR